LICTGISDGNEQNNFGVFPNPINEEFRIEFPVSAMSGILFLYSVDGKIIREWNVTDSNNQHFFIGELSRGIYFLKLFSENQISVLRVVKQ